MTSLLTSREVDDLRAALHLPDRVVVRRVVVASDGQGGADETLSTVAVVDGRVAPADRVSAAAGDHAGAQRTAQRWIFVAPYDTDVRPHDVVLVGTRSWRVQTVDAARSDQLFVSAEMEEQR